MDAARDSSIWALLTAYLVRAPLFLVWGVVALAAVTRWRMIPRQAFLALAAVAILVIDESAGTYLAYVLPAWVLGNWQPAQPEAVLATLLHALAFMRALAQAVAWGLMAWAALGRIVRPFEKG